MDAADDVEPFAGLARRFHGLGLGPLARGNAADAALAAGDERQFLGGGTQLEQCVGLACENVGVPGEFDQCDGIVNLGCSRIQPYAGVSDTSAVVPFHFHSSSGQNAGGRFFLQTSSCLIGSDQCLG